MDLEVYFFKNVIDKNMQEYNDFTREPYLELFKRIEEDTNFALKTNSVIKELIKDSNAVQTFLEEIPKNKEYKFLE